MIFIYRNFLKSPRRAVIQFGKRKPFRDISHKCVLDLVIKTFESILVRNKNEITGKTEVAVLETINANQTSSLQTVAQQTTMPHQILKNNKYAYLHPYKI